MPGQQKKLPGRGNQMEYRGYPNGPRAGGNAMTETSSDILIETAELETALGRDDLRIIDCDIDLGVDAKGNYSIRPCLDEWRAAHIPGSIYIDIVSELSAVHPTLNCMLPAADKFAAAMSERGIGDEHLVVLYSRGANLWATRLFMTFREFGHRKLKVLNGGWIKWEREGRPVTDEETSWSPTHYSVRPPAGRFVGKDAVAAAIADDSACVVNALSPAIYSGEVFHPPYGRPGHIPNTVNLYYMDLVDPETNGFRPIAEIEERLKRVGAIDADRVITYCGGGIAASADAFALHLSGRTDVELYDASLAEWGNDPSLPMETG